MQDLKPGRELDALIAERVMGIPRQKHEDGAPWSPDIQGIPEYSTDIAAAWIVVERIQDLVPGTVVEIKTYAKNHADVRIVGPKTTSFRAETAAHAICLAAIQDLSLKP